MIGLIALAGIIVRNSILLVDFINQQRTAGIELVTAVIEAGRVRAKPILLTALAAMIGALFILDDPIFSGLAISLLFAPHVHAEAISGAIYTSVADSSTVSRVSDGAA